MIRNIRSVTSRQTLSNIYRFPEHILGIEFPAELPPGAFTGSPGLP
jgi:hypothetical protein